MNPIKEIPPDIKWTDQAAAEICLSGQALLDASHNAWRIGNVAIVGLIYHNFMSPPYMWMALSKAIKFSDLLDFRRRAELIPVGTITYVNAAHDNALRFAKLYGFVSTGQEVEQHGNTYIIMRRG